MQTSKLTLLAGLLLVSLTVAGCSKTMASSGTDLSCSAFGPISWSSKDTPITIREVKGHNAAWKGVCQ